MRFERQLHDELFGSHGQSSQRKIRAQAGFDDLSQTLLAARKAFQTNPGAIDPVTQLGGMLAQHQAMTPNLVWSWSKTHGGQLLEPGVAPTGLLRSVDDMLVSEVNEIISNTIMKVGSRDFNATRLANALMVDATPANIAKLGKEIIAFGAKWQKNTFSPK